MVKRKQVEAVQLPTADFRNMEVGDAITVSGVNKLPASRVCSIVVVRANPDGSINHIQIFDPIKGQSRCIDPNRPEVKITKKRNKDAVRDARKAAHR